MCTKAAIKDPTTPEARRYTTLWNIGFQKLNWPIASHHTNSITKTNSNTNTAHISPADVQVFPSNFISLIVLSLEPVAMRLQWLFHATQYIEPLWCFTRLMTTSIGCTLSSLLLQHVTENKSTIEWVCEWVRVFKRRMKTDNDYAPRCHNGAANREAQGARAPFRNYINIWPIILRNTTCHTFTARARMILAFGYWVLDNICRYWVVLLLGDIFFHCDTQYDTDQTAVGTVHITILTSLVQLLSADDSRESGKG